MCESTDRRGWSGCPSLSTPPTMARSVNLRAGTLEDLAGPSREAVIVLRSCWRLVAVGALIAAASSMSCSTILAAGEDGVLDSTFGVAEALPGVVELPDLDAAFRGALQSNGDLVVAPTTLVLPPVAWCVLTSSDSETCRSGLEAWSIWAPQLRPHSRCRR